MKKFNKNKLRKYLRNIHRDMGYFFVGIILIYAASGLVLNHKTNGKDPVYKTVANNEIIETNISKDNFVDFWNDKYPTIELKRVVDKSSSLKLYIKGGEGSYNKANGELNFEVYTKNYFYYFVTKLHYNSKKAWKYMADIFAIALIIFALSGMFMIPGKNGLKGRGKWLLLIGFIIPFLFFL